MFSALKKYDIVKGGMLALICSDLTSFLILQKDYRIELPTMRRHHPLGITAQLLKGKDVKVFKYG